MQNLKFLDRPRKTDLGFLTRRERLHKLHALGFVFLCIGNPDTEIVVDQILKQRRYPEEIKNINLSEALFYLEKKLELKIPLYFALSPNQKAIRLSRKEYIYFRNLFVSTTH